MTDDRLQRLHAAGQSIWLDYIDRAMLRNGDLERRIRDDALSGMTSNPTIFEKALAGGTMYDEQLLAAPSDLTAGELFEIIATDDVRSACDIFRSTFDAAAGGDGFVSIEVSPALADDADATVREAHRLWRAVDRPNVMVKVPGTPQGAHAVRQLVRDGINVNVTLLFSREAYGEIIEAYLGGLEERASDGLSLRGIASVASFFVSRVDTEVDKRLTAGRVGATPAEVRRLQSLEGTIAIANAKLAYQLFREMFSGERWEALRSRGARLQRPLWASTSTKNPAYRDVMYVEELIGPDTVNTMPPATLVAFRDHGYVEVTVNQKVDDARRSIDELEAVGISLEDVTDTLLVEGVASFQSSFDSVIEGLTRKLQALGREVAGAR